MRAALLSLLLLPLAAAAQESPVDVPLVERATSRLAQIDVTVGGPPELAADLTREDFKLKVHMRWLEEFSVDRYCTPPAEGSATDAWQRRLKPAVSYLFYFDQAHLTVGGRARAMDSARELVDELIVNGNVGMIVSDAARLTVIEEFTDDAAVLRAAIDRLENDVREWDPFASEEDRRVARVVEQLNENGSVRAAIGNAKAFQREETARADRSLRRLAISIGRLNAFESRKAVLYFADTMRQNPGEHYMTFFGAAITRSSAAVGDMASGAFMSGNAFDRVVNEAAAQGIRFYPVYARGLVTPFDNTPVSAAGSSLAGGTPRSAHTRFTDAQNTLASLAAETGGHVFLRGESPTRIVEQLRHDFACLYTLSFDPTDLPQDDPLRVTVRILRPDVEIGVRGRIVLQSDKTLRAARLLNAFAWGDDDSELMLHATLVPTGYRKGAYAALLQVTVPGSSIPATSWELGASLINRDKVLDEVSRKLSVRRPGLPLVLEREIALKPGPHEIVAVAHEAATDFVLSEHLRVDWPDPDRQPITCGPLALVQPTTGAFVREGSTRTQGSLARGERVAVDPALPTALMGLVCRNRRYRGALRIERTLVGASSVEFPELQFKLESERCAQVRDLIPADTLTGGGYRYEIRVRTDDGELLDEAAREFSALDAES